MIARAGMAEDHRERNRRLLRLLLGVAAILAFGTIVYIALHRHV